ncbi:MAG TPA: helix-turn-helix transcriptional regulator [Tepidisphaeraceae bacterium]|nr:helix-turn-helix transcriptional regulator [Tepidisphaeraceae bacterium]
MRDNIPYHAHADCLQLDLAIDCQGYWRVDHAARPIAGATLSAFYPGQWHDYEGVSAARSGARIFSLKLRVDRDWPAVRARVLAEQLLEARRVEPLVQAWERLIRACASEGRMVVRQMRLLEVLTHWPRPHEVAAADVPLGHDDAVEAAMVHLEQRLHQSMSVDELAEHVCLSPRQFLRRFRAATGLAPHAYMDRRRLALAQHLLQHEGDSVTQIARELGFANVHSFSRWFYRRSGTRPSDARHGRGTT